MGGKNIKKILIGIVLILLAGFSAVTAFYFLEVKPELEARNKNSQPSLESTQKTIERRVQEIKEESKKEEVLSAKQQDQQSGISLKSLVDQAKNVYDEDEQNRNNGFLWIDRKSSKYVVTLGAVNSVLEGTYLSVFEGDQRIGQVVVDMAFDVISYVHPIDKAMNLNSSDYFRVIRE